MKAQSINIGMNARLFPNNWRPMLREIKFAHEKGFQSIQLSVRDRIIDQEFLGDEFEVVAEALRDADIALAIELLIGVDEHGRTPAGKTPLDNLEANLDAIKALECNYVHWHLVPSGVSENAPSDAIDKLEQLLIPQFTKAVQLAETHQFMFGFEHNEPDLMLFGRPERCKMLMDAVPGLKFVWDINHTIPEHLSEIAELVAECSIIHVSDTAWPEVNYHLPLGKGNLDFNQMVNILLENGFSGPAIFEIGGLPKSGGYGRDTDEALTESLARFQRIIESKSK